MERKQITSLSYFSKHLPTSLSWRLYEEGTLLKVNYLVNLLTNCFVLNSLVCFDQIFKKKYSVKITVSLLGGERDRSIICASANV